MQSTNMKMLKKEIKKFDQFETALELEDHLDSIGATLIGEGSYRQAWRLGDFVIKFAIGGSRLDFAFEDNLSEVNCYRQSPRILKKMFSKVYTELSCKKGKFVIMDYAPNEIHANLSEYEKRNSMVDSFERNAKKMCKNYRISVPSCINEDRHTGNFRRTASGKLVMIDLQCFGDY